MPSVLHITNGDSAANMMRAGGITGEILPWRDALHEGPVPDGLDLHQLSKVRARWLGEQGLGDEAAITSEFSDRDDLLRRHSDFDEVVLWFEWDLYDQLQLVQVLDFLASAQDDRTETGTVLSLVSHAGYLGALPPERFEPLLAARKEVTTPTMALARTAWRAFRSSDPRQVEKVALAETSPLEFIEASLWRHLEELPSTHNGLSRSEAQILQAVAHGPLSFHEIFKRVAHREDRVFCGDAIAARYIERMSLTDVPLIAYTSGEKIDAPRTAEDSRAFRNAEMALTDAGREVLACDRDWIETGGADRWLGGVHLDGKRARWRWDPEARRVVESTTTAAA